MVVRTDEAAPTRGGSVTTAFRKVDLPVGAITTAPVVSEAALRGNLERFLRRVLPIAEAAGIRLAMHPDDPPISPLAGYARIMSSPADLDWLMQLDLSPANALTLVRRLARRDGRRSLGFCGALSAPHSVRAFPQHPRHEG